jgi:magnesium transporter
MEVLAIQKDGTVQRDLTPAQTEKEFRESDSVVWVDMDSTPDADEQKFLNNLFGISDSAISHLTEPHRGPRAARYRSHVLVVLFEVNLDDAKQDLAQNELVLVIGKRFVLSLHTGPTSQVPSVNEQINQSVARFDVEPGAIVFALFDAVVDQYREIVREIGTQVDELETRVLAGKDAEAIFEIYDLGTKLTTLRRIITPEESLIEAVMTTIATGKKDEVADALLDLEHDLQSAVDSIEQYQSMLPNIMTTFESMKSDDLNNIVQLLTVWSIILTAVALFPTVLGISLTDGISLAPWVGYVTSIAVMVGIGAVVWLVLKREGWIN